MIKHFFARLVKCLMVVLMLPLLIGVVSGAAYRLEGISFADITGYRWVIWGFLTYVGVHLILFRPYWLFSFSHKIFSTLAVWLFGGQVASVEDEGRSRSRMNTADGDGSPLVAFSPYIVPFYTLAVCFGAVLLRKWKDITAWSPVVLFLVGLTLAFHWLMTADELQEQRDRWHIETYLLAISMVFLITLGISGWGLQLAVPEFSFTEALQDGFLRTRALYAFASGNPSVE